MTSAERVGPEPDVQARRRPEPDAAPRRVGSRPPSVRRSSTLMNPRSVAMLQRSAGNAAVAGLVAGRRAPVDSQSGHANEQPSPADAAVVPIQRLAAAGASTAPPVPPPARTRNRHREFAAVTGVVKTAGKQLKAHPPASAEVGKAQAAAKGPPDDKAGQAKAAQADAMAAAKPGGFDKAAFIAAVR